MECKADRIFDGLRVNRPGEVVDIPLMNDDFAIAFDRFCRAHGMNPSPRDRAIVLRIMSAADAEASKAEATGQHAIIAASCILHILSAGNPASLPFAAPRRPSLPQHA